MPEMIKTTAILRQRSGDYHISVKGNPGIWSCGKSLHVAIEAFKRTLKTFNFELETLEVDINSITEITWK